MGFHDEMYFIYTEFKKEAEKYIHTLKWDQRYITQALKRRGSHVLSIQENLPGVVSYKKNCLKGIPDDTRVVCFHGRPRPHEVGKPYFQEEYSL